eukprot:363725-Chlamydomonas_euryale.AAC.16
MPSQQAVASRQRGAAARRWISSSAQARLRLRPLRQFCCNVGEAHHVATAWPAGASCPPHHQHNAHV